ncbi:hypothetical protein GCM10022220_15950 [Actinocatenispora rupis]|uniref:Uncharacterized protein n=1 Tax=Actinocatenispora rupis TaxID=519421 RepID=A0A8J3IV23_9ACTN|nr:hypothetical protein Aru02nite_13550 [Actinocatenispora rupis]
MTYGSFSAGVLTSGLAPSLGQFGAHLVEWDGVAGGEVFAGFAEIGECVGVRHDVDRLLQRLVLRDRDEHDVGAAVPGDGEVVVFARDAVGELRDAGLGLRDRDRLHESQPVDRSEF